MTITEAVLGEDTAPVHFTAGAKRYPISPGCHAAWAPHLCRLTITTQIGSRPPVHRHCARPLGIDRGTGQVDAIRRSDNRAVPSRGVPGVELALAVVAIMQPR